MTTDELIGNIWTHGSGAAKRPHEWQYLGTKAQAYRCAVCQVTVLKTELKAQTDA